jgi:hypothetical protein
MSEKGIDIEIIKPGEVTVEITTGETLVFDFIVPESTNVEIRNNSLVLRVLKEKRETREMPVIKEPKATKVKRVNLD